MKFLRYFILILLLLIGVFILMGLLNKEISYKTETIIERPLGLVWEKFNDSEITMEYIPEIEKITPIKELPGIVGSTTEYKMGGSRPMKIIETVKAYEEGRLVTLVFDAAGMIKEDSYEFTDIGGKTKMVSTHNIKTEGVMMRAMYFLMKGLFKSTDKEHQTKFKNIVESRF